MKWTYKNFKLCVPLLCYEFQEAELKKLVFNSKNAVKNKWQIYTLIPLF